MTAESGETETARARHRVYYGRLAEEAEQKLIGPEQAAWLNLLQMEHDNFRALLDGCLVDSAHEQGLRCATGLWRFWFMRGYYREGRDRLTAFLASSLPCPDEALRTRALNGAGRLAACHHVPVEVAQSAPGQEAPPAELPVRGRDTSVSPRRRRQA